LPLPSIGESLDVGGAGTDLGGLDERRSSSSSNAPRRATRQKKVLRCPGKVLWFVQTQSLGWACKPLALRVAAPGRQCCSCWLECLGWSFMCMLWLFLGLEQKRRVYTDSPILLHSCRRTFSNNPRPGRRHDVKDESTRCGLACCPVLIFLPLGHSLLSSPRDSYDKDIHHPTHIAPPAPTPTSIQVQPPPATTMRTWSSFALLAATAAPTLRYVSLPPPPSPPPPLQPLPKMLTHDSIPPHGHNTQLHPR